MQPPSLRSICAAVAGTFTNTVSLFLLLEILVPVNRLLASGRLDDPGVGSEVKTLLGGTLLIVFCLGWLVGLIVSYRYYYRADSLRTLAGRLLFLTSLEILFVPVALFARIFVFRLNIYQVDALITLVCFALAGAAYAASRRLRFGRSA